MQNTRSLKKLRLNKYYEHVPFIANILNGIKPPNMPSELEECLRLMFKDIQRPFDDNCPTERKTFELLICTLQVL